MFTGIIEELGTIRQIQPNSLTVKAHQVLADMGIGDSIAVNGICLTITVLGNDYFTVDLMPETRHRTTLDLLRVGDEVNLERPLKIGGRMGGHLVQGHVDDTGKVITIRPEGTAALMRFEPPREVLRYVVVKGFIAVDGTSLTVIDRNENSFEVSLVTHTRQTTILGKRRVGDMVNLEVDIIAKYVEALAHGPDRGITVDFLQAHGFPVS